MLKWDVVSNGENLEGTKIFSPASSTTWKFETDSIFRSPPEPRIDSIFTVGSAPGVRNKIKQPLGRAPET